MEQDEAAAWWNAWGSDLGKHMKYDHMSTVSDPVMPRRVNGTKEIIEDGDADSCLKVVLTTSFIIVKSENNHHAHHQRHVFQ